MRRLTRHTNTKTSGTVAELGAHGPRVVDQDFDSELSQTTDLYNW